MPPLPLYAVSKIAGKKFPWKISNSKSTFQSLATKNCDLTFPLIQQLTDFFPCLQGVSHIWFCLSYCGQCRRSHACIEDHRVSWPWSSVLLVHWAAGWVDLLRMLIKGTGFSDDYQSTLLDLVAFRFKCAAFFDQLFSWSFWSSSALLRLVVLRYVVLHFVVCFVLCCVVLCCVVMWCYVLWCLLLVTLLCWLKIS